jgi:micrococcal nuclease
LVRRAGEGRKGVLFSLAIFALSIGAGALWTLSGGDPKGARVLVTDLVDGDTLHVGRGWRRTTVRLIGVDAPETVHPEKPVEFYGPEASEFTGKSLTGKWVRLEFEARDQTDVYGRLLAYIFLEDGTLFNRDLVRHGYARAYTRFPFRYQKEFRLAESEARNAGRGLWGRQKAGVTSSHPLEGKIVGNRRTKVFHVPGQANYGLVSEENRVYFDTQEEAVGAGYRRAKR